MSEEYDDFDFLAKDMSVEDKNKIVELYRGAGQGYNAIILNMSLTIFNWVMGLNIGGLSLTVAVMGNYLASHVLTRVSKVVFLLLVIVYLIGVIFAFLAGLLERKRFIKKGKLIDGKFKDFMDNTITAKEFIDQYYKGKQIYDVIVPIIEYFSFGCFFLSSISSVVLLFRV